jgi:hypothetical protein
MAGAASRLFLVLSLLALLVQKHKNTDAEDGGSCFPPFFGAQFACFTGTKARILTQKVMQGATGKLFEALARPFFRYSVSFCTFVPVKRVN